MQNFTYKAKLNFPKKKRNASSAGVTNDNHRSKKKGGKCGKGGGYCENNSGSNGRKSGCKYYGKATGKPTRRWINNVDVEPLFTKGNIPEKDLKRLPNIVKQWFASNC